MTNKLNDSLRVKPIADFSSDDLHKTHKEEMDEYIRLRIQGFVAARQCVRHSLFL